MSGDPQGQAHLPWVPNCSGRQVDMAQHRTLRKIGKRMGWSPAKVLRRHKLDDFPLYPDWTKWEERKVRMCQGARLRNPANCGGERITRTRGAFTPAARTTLPL